MVVDEGALDLFACHLISLSLIIGYWDKFSLSSGQLIGSLT